MRQYSLFPMLFPFSYLGVLITGPRQWATLSINIIVLDFFLCWPFFTLFPRALIFIRSVHDNRFTSSSIHNNCFLTFFFLKKTLCFILIWYLQWLSHVPDVFSLFVLTPVCCDRTTRFNEPSGNWIPFHTANRISISSVLLATLKN